MSIQRLLQFARGRLAVVLIGLLAALALATPASAQDDPPGRVGRVASLHGGVSWFDAEAGQWTEAERNLPLTGADRISTASDGRAELRIGSTVLRLANSSEIEILRLDDERLVVQLHAGSVAVRVRSREVADEVELVTAEARLLPARAGHYRIDRIDDTTLVGAWRGEIGVADTGWQVASGQRIELFRDNRGAKLQQTPTRFADDSFGAWALAEDGRDMERSASNRYVSPEMTGAEDLDRHGRWDQHPEYGAIWYPVVVQADWAPYRYGRWTWVRPWGWTWVDTAPWGFAPFHYGRWVHWRNHWGWVPGAYVARPVFAPALVAWIGGGHWSASVRIGGPPVGWVPLAPREAYRPHYRHTPVYVDRVNPGPRQHWHHPQHSQASMGRERRDRHERPWTYGNQAVPGAVTVVPSDVLLRRQPVHRAVIDVQRAGPAAGAWQRPATELAPAPPPPAPTTAVERPDRTDRRDDRRDGRWEARGDPTRDSTRDSARDPTREDRRGGPREGWREGRRDGPRDEARDLAPVERPGRSPSQQPAQVGAPVAAPGTNPTLSAAPSATPSATVVPAPTPVPAVTSATTPLPVLRPERGDRGDRGERGERSDRGDRLDRWRDRDGRGAQGRETPVSPPQSVQPVPAAAQQPQAAPRSAPAPRVEAANPPAAPAPRPVAPPPAAVPPPAAAPVAAPPPPEAQRAPRERSENRDDERKSRPGPTQRQQAR
jgi:hypothetical protein